MRSVDSWLDRFAYKHARFGIPNLMRLIVFANIAVYLLDMFSQGALSAALGLYPGLVFQGQIWRIITFIIVPEPSGVTGLGPLWFMFSMFFYYFLGSSMEQEWGTAKFTLFYACGSLLTLLASFISYGFSALFLGDLSQLFSMLPFTMGQVNFSLLLAFATLYPDMQFRIYFIIPVKAKWLAIFYLALQVWSFMRLPGSMFFIMLPILLPPILSALGNYALFFWSDIARVFRRAQRRTQHQTSKQTINFKKAAKNVTEAHGYLHKCSVCGKTNVDSPGLEFRYCSKCSGYYCYCMEHINNHVHIES